jgi:hypothetical protein
VVLSELKPLPQSTKSETISVFIDKNSTKRSLIASALEKNGQPVVEES